MRGAILKGQTELNFPNLNLTFNLSRPLKKKMYLDILTPEQSKKKEIEKRSNCQNKAVHMVCNDLFKNVGEYSSSDYYLDFKRNYLAFKIKQDDAEYAGMIERFEALSLVMEQKEWRKMADKIYTHKDSNLKQFHHAFNDFCMVHSSRGNQFRHPEDYRLMQQDEFYLEQIK